MSCTLWDLFQKSPNCAPNRSSVSRGPEVGGFRWSFCKKKSEKRFIQFETTKLSGPRNGPMLNIPSYILVHVNSKTVTKTSTILDIEGIKIDRGTPRKQ